LSTAQTFAAPARVFATFKLFEKALAEIKARIGRGIATLLCYKAPRHKKSNQSQGAQGLGSKDG
jgi:hypothetical protein